MSPAGYISCVVGIVVLVTYVWKAAASYTTLKNMQANMVTKSGLAEFETRIVERLRGEYVTLKEHEKLWAAYRELRDRSRR